MRSTEIVTAFWYEVWNAHEPDAVDRFMAEDVVIEAGGQEISGKNNVKNWVKEFLDHVNDLHVDTIENIQNDDGTRVTSRWVLTGTNNGILGTEPNGKPVAMTGTAVWTVATECCSAAGLSRPRLSSTTRYSRSNPISDHPTDTFAGERDSPVQSAFSRRQC
jgi:steroid delta-isomerase-like uncharacterized protein